MLLIVEDDMDWGEAYILKCPGHITPLVARTIRQGRLLFHKHASEITAIIMDGCVPGGELNTIPLIREIRDSGYAGLLIAASSNSHYTEQMVAAGCDRSFSDKGELARNLASILVS